MHQDVIWRKPTPFVVRSVPSHLQPWLLDRGSLTRALLKASHGRFRVEVIRQGWKVPSADERRALGMPDRRFALVREVALWGREKRWVLARSIIPSIVLRGRYRQLRRLGNRPLGELLHSDVGVRRGSIEIAVDCDLETPTWRRRSRYFLSGKPILVSETFLAGSDRPWSQPSQGHQMARCKRRQKVWCTAVPD